MVKDIKLSVENTSHNSIGRILAVHLYIIIAYAYH